MLKSLAEAQAATISLREEALTLTTEELALLFDNARVMRFFVAESSRELGGVSESDCLA